MYADFGDLGDIFEQFFGFGGRPRGRRRPAAERGADHRTRLRLGFEEGENPSGWNLEMSMPLNDALALIASRA